MRILIVTIIALIAIYKWTELVYKIAEKITIEDLIKNETGTNNSSNRYKTLYRLQKEQYDKLQERYNKKCEDYNALYDDFVEVATKLDKINKVELVDDYEYDIRVTDNLIEKFNGNEELAQRYIELCTNDFDRDIKIKKAHKDIITNAIEVLQAEGLINNYLTIRFTEDNDDRFTRYKLDNGQSVSREIYISYNLATDEDDFIIDYLKEKFDLYLPNLNSYSLFVFLHEFGHYIDSTLEHDKNYDKKNHKMKEKLSEIDDWEELQLAYRLIPCEAFADKWAVDFMKKHFTDYIGSCVLA